MLALLLLIIAVVVFIIRTRRNLHRVLSILLLLLIMPIWTALWDCAGSSSANLLVFHPRQTVGLISRTQGVYYLDKGKFSNSLEQLDLGLGSPRQNAQFVYSIRATPDAAFQYATTRTDCHFCRVSLTDWFPPLQASCFSDFCSKPIHCESRSIAGVTYVTRDAGEVTIKHVLCQGNKPGTIQLNPTYHHGIVDCGSDATEFK